MKIYYVVLLSVIVTDGLCEEIQHQQEKSVVQIKEEPGPGGIWQSKTQWKAHWVKHWEVRKIWVPMWRKVWGPVEVKEWIPFPKPPPTWLPPTWAPSTYAPPTWTPPPL